MFSTIAARAEFLPTDLTPEPITNFLYNNAGWFVLISASLAIASGFLIGASSAGGPRILRFIGAPLCAISVVTFAGTLLYVPSVASDFREETVELQEQSRDNFISNIESVYDAEVVKLDTSYISPANKVELIVSQDGVAYEVIATQDPDTYEPSLMVIASPTSEVTEIRKK